MTSNLSNLGMLIQQKQAKLDSITQQKYSVETVLNGYNTQATETDVVVGKSKISLSDAVVMLSNFKVVDQPDEANYQIEGQDEKTGEKTKTLNQEEFNKAMKEFEDNKAQHESLEKAVKEATLKLTNDENAYAKIMQTCQDTENKLASQNQDYQVTMGDIESIHQQMQQSMFTVTIDEENGGAGLVKQFQNDLSKLVKNDGTLSGNFDNQWADLCKDIVEADNANSGKNNNTNGMDKDYTTMQVGDKKTYTYEQFLKIAEGAGYKLDTESTGFALSESDIKELAASSEGEITKAGIKAVIAQAPTVTGPTDDAEYEKSRLSNVKADFTTADGKEGKIDGDNYYIDGKKVTQEEFEAAKNGTTSTSEPVETPTPAAADKPATVKDLKAGESIETNNGIVTKNNDGTYTLTTATNIWQNGKYCAVNETKTYSDESMSTVVGTTRYSTDVFGGGSTNVKVTTDADGTETYDLSNINEKNKSIGATPEPQSMLKTATRKCNDYESQTFNDKNGNALVTVKDGKYYEGTQEISFAKAEKILNKAYKKDTLGNLVRKN